MKKILLIVILAVMSVTAFSQYQNIGSPYGNNMEALNARKAFQLPRGTDTTLNAKADTAGMLYYKTVDKSLWLRVPIPGSTTINKWVKIADSSGGGGGGGSQSWDATMAISPNINSSYSSDFNSNNWTWADVGTFTLNASSIVMPLSSQSNINYILTQNSSNGIFRSTFSSVADSLQPYLVSGNTSFTWSVLDSLNTPPGAPSTGDTYEVGTVPTGAWVGHVGDIAEWDGAAWIFSDPEQGDLLYNGTTDFVSKWTGSVWVRISPANIHQGGDAFGINPMRIGTNNNRPFQFETNNTVRFTIGQTGTYTFATLTGASDGIMGLGTTGLASNVQAGTGVVITSSLIRVDTSTIHTSAYNDGRYLQNITGLVTAGSGISVTGSGTSGSPYVVAATGGGGEDLETTMDIGSVLSQDHTIDHTGFSLTATGLNQTWNADNVLRGAAVDSVAFTSLATLDLQAGTEMKMKTVTGTFDATTRASFGFRTGTGDSVFFEAKSEVMRFIAPVTSNISANPAIKTMVRDTITGQIGWANAAGVALTTNQIGVGIASVLNSYSTFQYNGTTQTINNNGVGTTQTDALNITNSTAATSGQPQYSGRQNFFGSSFNTTGSAAITQGVGVSFVTYSGAVATNVGYLAFTYYDAGYGSTPTFAIQKNHVLVNRGVTTVSNAALDVTENSGESALVLRDEGGVNSRTFSVSSTGVLTIGTTQSGNVIASGFEGQLSTGSGGIANTNLFAASGTNGSNGAFPGIAGSSNLTNGRVGMQATTTITPTASQNHSAFAVGPNAVTKAATGTHDIFANATVYGMTINSGASTLTKAATFVINGIATGSGAPAGAEDNLALWVYTGISRFGGEVLLRAGTTAANTAPLKFVSGTNMTTAETGSMEYDGTNLFFTRTGTTRESVITANAVNSVSPTAPNRTITVVIDGTTYYISAKTTND